MEKVKEGHLKRWSFFCTFFFWIKNYWANKILLKNYK